MNISSRVGRRQQAWRLVCCAWLAAVISACAYQPREGTPASMTPHFARVYVINNLLHNPERYQRPSHFYDDYSGQILSVDIASGRIRIVAANRTVDLALADLQPSADGPRVFLIPNVAIVTPSADSSRLADALFTLKQAAMKGEVID